MNYQAILLVTGGVMLGALTFSAIGVSAHGTDEINTDGQRRGTPGAGMMERRMGGEGKEYAAKVLGLTPEEIRAEMDSGKTMEEVVKAQGYESIESFRDEVENKVREKLAADGLSQEEIDARIERHENRMQDKFEHMSENFNEDRMRERMSDRGFTDEEINSRLERVQDRMESFRN